jgi:hypothetical protein
VSQAAHLTGLLTVCTRLRFISEVTVRRRRGHGRRPALAARSDLDSETTGPGRAAPADSEVTVTVNLEERTAGEAN